MSAEPERLHQHVWLVKATCQETWEQTGNGHKNTTPEPTVRWTLCKNWNFWKYPGGKTCLTVLFLFGKSFKEPCDTWKESRSQISSLLSVTVDAAVGRGLIPHICNQWSYDICASYCMQHYIMRRGCSLENWAIPTPQLNLALFT